ncbi:MAG: sulfite oxidase-like oxidoreductase [Rhodospirillaceae bacterium]|nr:MAG: sulfite oxidase-like oxidoreductase [Rhodospirillaceae bacterium]
MESSLVTVSKDGEPRLENQDEQGKRDKLIRRKQEWAAEGRLLTGTSGNRETERLPPGQRLVQNWPVLDLGVHPDIPRDKWRLWIDGAVANPQKLDWTGFQALPQSNAISDIHCVTSWSRYDNRWRGVLARDLLDLVKPLPDAQHVILHSYDTYTTNVPLAEFADTDVLLATHWQDEELSLEHGGPLRLIVPKLYFWKSAKWLKRIEFAVFDKPGFWELRGYHNHGDPWDEERYDD